MGGRYREAQVCFTTVEQQLLMVIYAPRRGLLEAWKVPTGHLSSSGQIYVRHWRATIVKQGRDRMPSSRGRYVNK